MNRAERRREARRRDDEATSIVRTSPNFKAAKAADINQTNIEREEALIRRGVRVDPAAFVERRLRALADVLGLDDAERAEWELLYQQGVSDALTVAEDQAADLEDAAARAAREHKLTEGVAGVGWDPRTADGSPMFTRGDG